ncbi:MAG: 5'-nucleotidase C-terminal domain-containing protein [Thermodesulfobacteriota bacterium]
MKFRSVFRTLKIFFVLFLIGWMTGCAGHVAKPDPAAPIPLTVLFFNDLHGHLKPFEVKDEQGGIIETGGIARMAYLVRGIREENNRNHVRTIVLVAGDILQGTPMSTVFRGEPDIKCLNAMGVDAAAVGNHEFDFGLDNFLSLKKQAGFPFLSANIVEKNGGRLLCDPYLAIDLNEAVSVTIIGVTTRELLTTTKDTNVATLDVLDSVGAVRQAYEAVKSRGPVILLSHSRHQTDREIAAAIPGLAAIIGGHDQILLSPYRLVGNVPVLQAFEKGRYLGRIDLEIDPVTKMARLIRNSYIPIVAGMPGDAGIADIVAAYDRRLGDQYKEVIGRADTFLDGERERIRCEETALGNFVTDVMAAYTGADIALINAGALRASIKQGPVTVEDVFKAMPYANELLVTGLTGREIEEMLKRSVSGAREEEDGGFLQVSGIYFDVRGRQVGNVRVGRDRQPMDAEARYTVAVPDFLSTGGDGYAMLKGKSYINTGLPLRELLVDTIRKQGVIAAGEEGRIRRME